MKRIQLWLVGLLALGMIAGCDGSSGGGTAGSSSKPEAANVNSVFTSYAKSTDVNATAKTVQATLLAQPIGGGSSFQREYGVSVRESEFSIIETVDPQVPAGTYDFSMLIVTRDSEDNVIGTYAGQTLGFVIQRDVSNSVRIVLYPVIGNPMKTVYDVPKLLAMIVEYPSGPSGITSWAEPRLLIPPFAMADGTIMCAKCVFSINKTTLSTTTPLLYFNVPAGQSIVIDPSVFDGSIKMTVTADPVTITSPLVAPTTGVIAPPKDTDIISITNPYTAGVTYSPPAAGSTDGNFVFTIPDDAIVAVGGDPNNLIVTASVTGSGQPLASLKYSGEYSAQNTTGLVRPATAGASWTLPMFPIANFTPGVITWSLTMTNRTSSLVFGYCGKTVEVTTTEATFHCNLVQQDPTLTTVAPQIATTIRVVDGTGVPVPGAVVSVDGDRAVVITGSGMLTGTTQGEANLFLTAGDHPVQASFPLVAGAVSLTGTYTVSAPSTLIIVTIPMALAQPPVSNFVAIGEFGQVSLTWTNPDATVWPWFAGVKIARSATAYPQYDPATGFSSDSAIILDTLSANATTSFVDTNFPVVDGVTPYYYRAFAYDMFNGVVQTVQTAGASTQGFAVPQRYVCTAPGTVTNFTAVVGDNKVTLTWSNPIDPDFFGVIIRRSASFYPQSVTAGDLVVNTGTPDGGGRETVTYTDTRFTDDDISNELPFYYSAFAYCTAGTPAASIAYAAATLQDLNPPGPVTAFKAVAGVMKVDLSWANPEPLPSDYYGLLIVRKQGSAPIDESDGNLVLGGYPAVAGTTTKDVSASMTAFTDSAVVADVTYYYRAFTVDNKGNVQRQGSATVDKATPTAATPSKPAAPLVLTASRSPTSPPSYSNGKGPNWSGWFTVPAKENVQLLAGNPDRYLLRLTIGDVRCYYLGGKWTAPVRGEETDEFERIVVSPTCVGGRRGDGPKDHRGPYRAGDVIYTRHLVKASVVTGDPKAGVTTVQVTVPVIWNQPNPDRPKRDHDDGDNDGDD